MPRNQQHGYIYLGPEGKSFHIRYNVWENGVCKQRSRKLCDKTEDTPTKDALSVIALAEALMMKVNAANAENDAQPGHKCPICGNRCKRTIQGKFATRKAA